MDRPVQVALGFWVHQSVSVFISDVVILVRSVEMAGSVEIWPDHDKISLDLNEISPNLVQSNGFQVNFRWIASNIVGFCMFSLKNLRISPEVSRFMIGSGCSGFGRGKPPIDPKASSFVGGDPPSTVGVSI